MVGGATLTKLLGTSAWYAPGAAGAALVEAIVRDEKKVFPCCVMLDGEYGQKDICIGVPVVIGKNGVEKIVNITLTEEENAKFLEDSGVGIWLKQKENCDEIITELLNDENKLNQMRKNTESLAKKNSTMDICRTILIQQKPE